MTKMNIYEVTYTAATETIARRVALAASDVPTAIDRLAELDEYAREIAAKVKNPDAQPGAYVVTIAEVKEQLHVRSCACVLRDVYV